VPYTMGEVMRSDTSCSEISIYEHVGPLTCDNGRVNPTYLRRHFTDLAAASGVAVRLVPVRRGHGGWADRGKRRVTVRPVETVTAYATAMHELGHVLSGWADDQLSREALAWDWALCNMSAEAAENPTVQNHVMRCLAAHYWCALVNNDAIPALDHLFWELWRLDWANSPYARTPAR
jgi:hypothetical protein